jgi:opacity protein-like surface antigen
MMRKLMALVGSVAVLSGGSVAQAQQAPAEGWYLQGNLTSTWVNDDHYSVSGASGDLKYDNPAWGGSAAGGYKLGNGFRLEGEFGYSQFKAKSATVNGTSVAISSKADVYSLTVNGYYDLVVAPGFVPYVGGGIGVAKIDVGTATATVGGTTVTAAGRDETDLIAFGEIGIAIGLDKNLDVVPSYRYVWLNDGKNGFDDDTAHMLRLGVRYSF